MSRGSGGIKGGVAKIVILDLLVYKIRLYHLGQIAYLIGIRHRPGPTVQSSKGLPWLVDVLLAVEREQVQAGTPAGTDWRPSMLQRRAVIERSFRLQIRSEVQRVRPLWLTRRDNAAMVRHAENNRRGRVEFRGIQKPKGGYRPQQLRLLGASGKAELDAVVQDRRLEIVTALSDGYMRVRVAVLRTWVHYCVEGRGTTPWRVHWPADDGDDSLMSDYLTVLSLRYTDFGVVEASLTHVLEFHKGFLKGSS